MEICLLDTDTLSEIIKAHNPQVLQQAVQYLQAHQQFTFSIITRYEILRGLQAKQATRQIRLFEERCQASEILPITDEIILRAADIYGNLHRQGQLISDADILIASTALVHGITLVTENVSHFQRIPGLKLQHWRTTS